MFWLKENCSSNKKLKQKDRNRREEQRSRIVSRFVNKIEKYYRSGKIWTLSKKKNNR